uniref:50S ribosomal protein L22 n=1 Tax=Zeugodacus cucurbitae TaxID=28588 RepID=A0A0A1XC62_ZEUCU
MCNPYYNCGSSCSTPAASKKCQTSCRLDDCHRYVHLLHHWYDKPELPKKCTCCDQIRCKKNNLLHKLCPVPGVRGETMKQVLFTQAIPLCASPPQKCETVVPKTEMCEDTIQRKQLAKDESNPARRLLVELNAGTDRRRAVAAQNQQMNTFVKSLKNWYAKEMKNPACMHTTRDAGPAYIETKTRKRKPNRKQPKRNSGRSSYHWTSDFNFTLENELSDSVITITSDTRLSIITTKHDVEEVDETIAMEDISNLLKQIQSKPDRPILFHAPFNRDVVWTWRNYDPLDDIPKSLAKKKKEEKALKTAYTPWTMNIVNDLIEGKPVSDKQFKTNRELQSVVNKLALEIKSGKVHRVKRKTR